MPGRLYIFCLFLLTLNLEALGQLEVQNILRTETTQSSATLRTRQEVLELPFWDDFSSSNGQPDGQLWEDSENVSINPTLGANPPTLHIATFDGTDALGFPYDINSQFVGNTDNLMSRPIDLTAVPANKLNSVFISFFWQSKGKGEIPNEVDSLRLQFLTSDSLWVTQFVLMGGASSVRTDDDGNEIFTQEILKVEGEEFFHDRFRFRFQTFGRLTGPFDTWHLDYVYLNQDRNFSDLAYFDRGITQPPTSLFGDYWSIPADQYFEDPTDFITNVEFELFNLDALPHPVEFTMTVHELVNDVLVDQTNEPTTTPILQGLERRFVETNLPDLSALDFADSLVLETEIIYNTGDRNLIRFIDPVTGDTLFYDNVDFKVNDTLRRRFNIHNYLAYDDGTAEFAAGINQIRGQLAYKYFIPSSDTLTDIDIHFPRIAPSADGQSIELIIWRRLSTDAGSIIAKQPFTIQQQSEPNTFTRYTLEFPLIVQDTIFIGWQQFSDNFIGVGLDKNTDAGANIFVNVDGEWRENVGIEGSLMLRPVFRRAESAIITSVDQEQLNDIQVFPNPNRGTFSVSGDYDELRFYDLTGKPVRFRWESGQVRLEKTSPGIYLAEIRTGKEVVVRRFLLQ